MTKKILITRPRAESEKLAAEIAARGFAVECLIEPMIEIAFLGCALPDPSNYAALVFTSANGVAAFIKSSDIRDIQVYAVGQATAARAKEAGFRSVRIAPDGNLESLNRLLAGEKFLAGKRVLHISGEDVSGEVRIPETTIERHVAYRAEGAKKISDKTLTAISGGDLAAVMFFSPRTARIFSELIHRDGYARYLSATKALCISDSVIKCLTDLPFKDVRAASTPDTGHMLGLLEGIQV